MINGDGTGKGRSEKKRWYAMPPEEVVAYLGSDSASGLDEGEARARLKALGKNNIFPIPHRSFRDYLGGLPVNAISVLLLLTALLSALFGEYLRFIIILIAFAFNYTASAAVFIKANRTLDLAGKITLPTATVLRSGRVFGIRQQNVVPGDIILISAGQIVPADARLIDSERLILIETGITEARGSVTKDAYTYDARVKKPHECVNMVYASTIVVSGSGRAVVVGTGEGTLVCSSGKNASGVTYGKLKTFRALESFSYIATLILLLSAALLTVCAMAAPGGPDALEALLLALSFAGAAMSESYTVFGYMVVAIGVNGALDAGASSNSGALIRNTERLDTLKDISAVLLSPDAVYSERSICLDKLYLFDRVVDISGGEIPKDAGLLLAKALVSTGNYTASRLMSKNSRGDNVYTFEEDAIIRAATELGIYNRGLDDKYPIIGHAGKGEALFETTLIRGLGENRVFLRGELSEVLALCTCYSTDNGQAVIRMSATARKTIETMGRQIMRRSHRVVAVASGASRYNSLIRTSELYRDLVFEGLIAFNEPTLPGAAHNVIRCRENNIKVMLFTDSDNERGRLLAETLDITDGEDGVITSAQAAESADFYEGGLDAYRLFCGFSVVERRKIIRLLQAKGERVACFGVDTAEIILNREADIGVTCAVTLPEKERANDALPENPCAGGTDSIHSSDALRFCSDVIVSPVSEDGRGGFNGFVSAVCAAKFIYFTLSRIISYLLTVNVARAVLVFATLVPLFGIGYSTPTAAVLSGLVFDFCMVFSMALEKSGPSSLRYSCRGRAFPFGFQELIKGLVTGAFAALVTTGWFTFAVHLGIIAISSVPFGVFVSSFLISSVIFLLGGKSLYSFRRELAVGRTFAFTLLLFTATVTLIMLFGPVAGLLGLEASLTALAVSPVPALLTAAFIIIQRLRVPLHIKKRGKQA